MKSVVSAFVVSLVVGLGVWAAVNSVPWWEPFRVWGLFFGSFAAVVTLGLFLMLLAGKSRRLRSLGRWTAVATLVVFGMLVSFGPYGAFAHSPFSLEGLWLYPLGITPLVAAAWLIVAPRRRLRPRLWDTPPRPQGMRD